MHVFHYKQYHVDKGVQKVTFNTEVWCLIFSTKDMSNICTGGPFVFFLFLFFSEEFLLFKVEARGI